MRDLQWRSLRPRKASPRRDTDDRDDNGHVLYVVRQRIRGVLMNAKTALDGKAKDILNV
jgi:hypothetical protein